MTRCPDGLEVIGMHPVSLWLRCRQSASVIGEVMDLVPGARGWQVLSLTHHLFCKSYTSHTMNPLYSTWLRLDYAASYFLVVPNCEPFICSLVCECCTEMSPNVVISSGG